MAAVFYDAILLFAVLFLATAIALPFNAGIAFSTGQYGFVLYLLGVSYLYYAWFWTHGGQTLGLKAWGLKLRRLGGGDVGWRQATMRFIVAFLSWIVFGLGFLWCLFSREKYCWHDAMSKTRLIRHSTENSGRQK
jgi:uncharacterized RDD family membrane protein YckC